MNEPTKFKDYNLRVPDVAKLLGYHEQYVRYMAVHGKIPAMKRGRVWIFSEAEILEKFKKDTKEFHDGFDNRRKNGSNKVGTADLLQ